MLVGLETYPAKYDALTTTSHAKVRLTEGRVAYRRSGSRSIARVALLVQQLRARKISVEDLEPEKRGNLGLGHTCRSLGGTFLGLVASWMRMEGHLLATCA